MKQSQSTATLLTLALLLCFAMPAGAFEIGARALYWFPAFKADMKMDAAGLPGNDVNLKDTLGVGTKYYPSFEAYGGLGRHNLSLAYTPIAYSGSTSLAQQVDFGGQKFLKGTTVDTDLKLRMLDLEYKVTLLDMENILAGFSLGAIGKIKYIDGDAMLTATGQEASQAIRLPIPMVGLAAHVGLLANILEARAKLTGIAYSGNYLYEALADLSLTPFPFLDINAGYKVIQLRVDHKDLFLDAQFTGPYVGLTVGF